MKKFSYSFISTMIALFVLAPPLWAQEEIEEIKENSGSEGVSNKVNIAKLLNRRMVSSRPAAKAIWEMYMAKNPTSADLYNIISDTKETCFIDWAFEELLFRSQHAPTPPDFTTKIPPEITDEEKISFLINAANEWLSQLDGQALQNYEARKLLDPQQGTRLLLQVIKWADDREKMEAWNILKANDWKIILHVLETQQIGMTSFGYADIPEPYKRWMTEILWNAYEDKSTEKNGQEILHVIISTAKDTRDRARAGKELLETSQMLDWAMVVVHTPQESQRQQAWNKIISSTETEGLCKVSFEYIANQKNPYQETAQYILAIFHQKSIEKMNKYQLTELMKK